jgi:dihydropyrimidinase
MTQLLIINGTIINYDSTSNSDIAVSEGLITEIGNLNPKDFPDYQIIDAKGKHIFPGGIDPHVHLG